MQKEKGSYDDFLRCDYKNIIVNSQEYPYESSPKILTYIFPWSASPTYSPWNVSSYILPSSHGTSSNKTCVMRILQCVQGWLNHRIQDSLAAKLDPQQYLDF